MTLARSLYDEDFYCWTEQQARLLRGARQAGFNLPLDWENLAEEIESLGRSDRRELRNRVRNIMVHLIKLQFSPAVSPRRGWIESVLNERVALMQGVLRDSPSLKQEIAEIVQDQLPPAIEVACDALAKHGELSESSKHAIEGVAYSEAEVLGNWLPDQPSSDG